MAENKTDAGFYTERQYMLQRFLRKLCKLPFIINGEECQLFLRAKNQDDVGGQITKLPTLDLQATYMRMAESCNISMSEYNEAQIGKMNIEISEYLTYCKKVEPLLLIIF